MDINIYVFYIIAIVSSGMENINSTNDIKWDNVSTLPTVSMLVTTNTSTWKQDLNEYGSEYELDLADISIDKMCNVNHLSQFIVSLCKKIKAADKWKTFLTRNRMIITPAILLVLVSLGLIGNIIALMVLKNDILVQSTKIMFLLLTSRYHS